MRVQSRRTDAFPTTWEIPVGIGLVWLMSTVLALPVGQGVAFALRGDGFVWPGPELFESLSGLLSGDPGRGLSADLRRVVPPGGLVYAAAFVVEVLLAGFALAGLAWWWRTVGPYAQSGMATRHEVMSVLGRGQLVRRRKMIRPDLEPGSAHP